MRNRLALIAATVTLLTLSGPAVAQTWTIPGTVNASGLNGTRFVSDLAITNPGTVPVTATVALLPANGTAPAPLSLGPGQTIVSRNLLQQLWGASGAGASVVTASSPLLIRARTYNTAASGTYGVALPVFPGDRFLSAGGLGESLWVSQSADGSKGYRTNVAVVFPDAAGGDATVTVYDATGNPVGSQAYSLADPGFQQFAVGSFAGAVAVARAELVVSRGHAAGYAVVVDNVTGDSSLFAFEDLPAGRQDVLVNGVARASGRNGTFFRTDARVYNPTDSTATVNVAFHANQSANPSPATASFTVPSGGVLDVVDVLQTFLGLPVGSAGALRFTSDAPVAILCRTSNVDPTGATPGTYGAQQKPVPLLSFLTSADSGAVVTGIRQGSSFRTNVGFAAGADGASYSLTLKNAAGAAVGTTSGSLGAWGWTQPNVQDLFSATVPDDALLQVNVTAGSLDVFDSSIDNASGDPVVTPIMPLPVAIPSSATIGPAGGSVQSSDGRLALLVPAGALASPTTISIGTAASDAPQGAGPAYVLAPANPSFGKPVLARLSYGADDLKGSGAAALGVAFHQPDGWYVLGDGLLDPGRRTLTVALPAGGSSGSARRELGLPTLFDGHIAIFQAWEIAPKETSVLGGGIVHFAATYSGQPSTIPCITPFCYAKITTPTGVDLQWGVQGDSAFGTISPPSGTQTTYTAPCGRVGAITVYFAVGFQGVPGLTRSYPNGRATVTVYPRRWQLTMEEKRTAHCPCGLLWNWTSRAVDEFTIQDSGGSVANLRRVDGNGISNSPAACLSCASCSYDIPDSWPLLTIDALTGVLDLQSKGMVFTVSYTDEASFLGFTVSCPGGTETKPSVAGASYTTGNLVLGPFGVTHTTGTAEDYTKWTFTPLPGCN
jgi:hypothetical protein